MDLKIRLINSSILLDNGCWLWNRTIGSDGYGKITLNNKTFRAHRVSWEAFNGAIPKGIQVLHNCPSGDNPKCINPDHLFLGTHKDNMKDCVNKNRRPRGENNGRAKLTEEQAVYIKYSSLPVNELKNKFSVNRETVRHIKKGIIWKHI